MTERRPYRHPHGQAQAQAAGGEEATPSEKRRGEEAATQEKRCEKEATSREKRRGEETTPPTG